MRVLELGTTIELVRSGKCAGLALVVKYLHINCIVTRQVNVNLRTEKLLGKHRKVETVGVEAGKVTTLAKEQGKTVILITHFMEEAALCDRVIVMNDGAVLLDGAPKEVFSKRKELKSVGLSVPAVTELCAILNENGVEIQSNIISEEECLKEVLKILKG